MEFLCYNGTSISYDAFRLEIDNRSFRYGDGLFESIKYFDGQPLLMPLHINRLLKGMSVLCLDIDPRFEVENLAQNIQDIVKANRINDTCRLRLSVFRESGGFYAPQKMGASYIIECISMNDSNDGNGGVSLGVYEEIPKAINILSNLKTSNSLVFVLAGIYKNKNDFDDVVLMNEKGNIVETISSNIFLVKDNEFSTPLLSEGCVEGVQREHVIEKIKMEGMLVTEKEITMDKLKSADEVFLTNAIHGISWVRKLDEKMYSNQKTIRKGNEK
ncbi:MAG TPA: 4-amino-4-deoxychorismate lyase [Flavobacteriales bacterium]|nr:4-amino-4-deoxychorismate lyase [Flavobacteriales bacterium]